MSGDVAVGGNVAAERQMYAQWVAAMMAQESPAGAPAAGPAPAMRPDAHAAIASQGQAAPAVDLGQAGPAPGAAAPGAAPAADAPPELGFDGSGRLMVVSSNTPYLGMDLRVAGRADAATGQWIPSEPLTITDASGQPVDLEALERQHGIGAPPPPTQVPAEAPPGHPAAQNGAPPAQAGAAAAPASGAPAPDEPMLNPNQRNAQGLPQIVYPDGRQFMGRELYFNEQTQQIIDAQGQVVDPNSLGMGPAVSDADRATVRRIRNITTVASGAMGVGMDYLWYRSTAQGMASRLASTRAASTAFRNGTSIQGRLANTPVIGSVVNRLQTRREGQIETLSRNVRIARMNPAQEARFLARERLSTLKAESTAFRNGTSLAGRVQNTPVIGRAARAVETRRQSQITALRAEIRTGATPSAWTRVRNATRGRVLPAIMLASDAYSVYNGVRHWNDPGNDRKSDDALRIAGNAVSAAGSAMAFRRGNLRGAIATHAAGLVISTIGNLLNDQD